MRLMKLNLKGEGGGGAYQSNSERCHQHSGIYSDSCCNNSERVNILSHWIFNTGELTLKNNNNTEGYLLLLVLE